MKITIRETKEEDFDTIALLLKETNLIAPYFTHEKFTQMLKRNKGYCFVACDDDHVAGNVFGNHDGAFRGYIHKLAVATAYQRQGLASRLVQALMKKFDAAQIPLVFAHVEKKNTPSLRLFESLGFELRDSHYLIDKGYVKK